MLNRKKKRFSIMVPLFLCMLSFNSIKGSSSSIKQENTPSQTQSKEVSQSKIELSRDYTFFLTPEIKYSPSHYTRREIESFLCACTPGFIRAEDLKRTGANGTYHVISKQNAQHQLKLVEYFEINKWFETQVTITAKGNLTPLDIETIKGFYYTINQTIGQKKFIFKPNLEVANIIIEMAPPDDSHQVHLYVGEASILHDNMAVRLTSSDQTMKPKIETYKLGSGKLINKSRNITLSPEEMEFRKSNRLVKIYMQNILDPYTRYFAFVHELLHSIGFTGHSPYEDSHLFPVPVRAFPDPLPLFRHNAPVLSKLALRMVEILYRPEILPAMTVKEAREVLFQLKPLDKTEQNTIITFLHSRQNQLESQQKQIMDNITKLYAKKMNLYLDLDKLVNKEQLYLDELKEIRQAYGLPFNIVNEVNEASTVMAKLIRIRTELIITESQINRYKEKPSSPEKAMNPGEIKRILKRLQEEIIVLRDLLVAETKVSEMERVVMTHISSPEQKNAEEILRRILRQLFTIDDELNRLGPLTASSFGK